MCESVTDYRVTSFDNTRTFLPLQVNIRPIVIPSFYGGLYAAMATTDIRTKSLKKPVDVAEYLFTRLSQVGVRSVHGVPGDYNLTALDYLPKAGLKWVGSVNELNAGDYFVLCPLWRALQPS